MKLVENVRTLLLPDKAIETAVKLNADTEDDWLYVVEHFDTGYSIINIYDDNGEYVGTL